MIKGRPKGGKNKNGLLKKKLEIVLLNVEKHIGTCTLEKQFHVNRGIGLQSKKRIGNPFSAPHTSKSLSREEYLELENMKLKVEIERLKKGYVVKGVGARKEFVTINDMNTKSLKS